MKYSFANPPLVQLGIVTREKASFSTLNSVKLKASVFLVSRFLSSLQVLPVFQSQRPTPRPLGQEKFDGIVHFAVSTELYFSTSLSFGQA